MTKEGLPAEGSFFHALHRIHLEKTVYPFTLRGEAYLKSPWKRSLDVSVGIIGLVASLFPIVVTAGVMKIESPDLPSFITQYRYGIGNKKFPMHKIRSQREVTNGNGTISPTFFGSIIRRLSIDELPQIIDVLMGNMSLVGRRPTLYYDYTNLERRLLADKPYMRAKTRFGFTDEQWRGNQLPQETKRAIEEYADIVRNKTCLIWEQFYKNEASKPGITGLYQVMGRRAISPEYRARLDLFYEKNASLGLDLTILIATIPVVFSTKGAK